MLVGAFKDRTQISTFSELINITAKFCWHLHPLHHAGAWMKRDSLLFRAEKRSLPSQWMASGPTETQPRHCRALETLHIKLQLFVTRFLVYLGSPKDFTWLVMCSQAARAQWEHLLAFMWEILASDNMDIFCFLWLASFSSHNNLLSDLCQLSGGRRCVYTKYSNKILLLILLALSTFYVDVSFVNIY